MYQHTNQIAQIIKEHGMMGRNHGLMHGNTGLCIFLYHLAQHENNSEYKKLADDLLDKIFDDLHTSAFVNFENGLLGIGWGIEYLLQNGFVEGDSDDILEVIDNKIFKVLHEEKITSFDIENGLTGYLFYLVSRLKNSQDPNSMAQLINRELLIMAVNSLDELVTKQFPSIIKDICFDLLWRFPIMLHGLIQAFELNIYNEKIRCMINQWITNLEAYIPSMHINRIYLATILTSVNTHIPNKRLEKQIKILLFATDFETLKTEVDPNSLNISMGWPGFIWVLHLATNIIPNCYPNYETIEMTYREIKLKYLSSLDKILENRHREKPEKFGLISGLAGFGLMQLLAPEVFINN